MTNENQLLQEISFLIKIFDRAFLLLLNDKFHFDEFQIERLKECKEISEELDKKNFDIIFMQLANEGFKEIVFNDLLKKISKYDDLVFEKKLITNNKFLNSYFEKIPELIKIQQWIKIKENDILEVEQSQSGMPQLEKQNIINELEKELIHLKLEREQVYNKYSWIKTNYYFKILA
jgi:predicted RND superfamily exporter protein